ncbi:hypothetical protein HYH03_014105 [Edaphochlamys debaryana]|uniref:DUF3533 domain-containing protein n=1 Tax=Edaphochlamys debaryana TaxID=47281 RepID=A0A835XWX7_9CHLO|nr:hypothetical protein HYH03_014105 [Edaphochlamys debaryana]|eukprot:KAG2487264.1 hypothetical protein HYH03_014105 [Edaphochlamys debaryana]
MDNSSTAADDQAKSPNAKTASLNGGQQQRPAGEPSSNNDHGVKEATKEALDTSGEVLLSTDGMATVSVGLSPEEQAEASFFRPYWTLEFAGTALFALLMIWCYGWLYLGAFWNPLTRLEDLHVSVLNCDVLPPTSSLNASFAPYMPVLAPRPLATSLLAGSIYNTNSPLGPGGGSGRSLTWDTASCPGVTGPRPCGTPEEEAACMQSLSNDVRQGGPWALLYFPSTFTTSYLSWYTYSGIAPQLQSLWAQYVIARGRCYSTYNYVSAVTTQSLVPGLSRSLTQALASNPAAVAATGLNLKFLATGITPVETDLAPVKNFGQHFASYIFCVLLWLGSTFMVVTSWQFKLPVERALMAPPPARPSATGPLEDGTQTEAETAAVQAKAEAAETERRHVRLGALAWALWVKGFVAAVFMFILSVLLCCLLWALGAGNEQFYKNAGQTIAFGWYMSWSFIAINALLLHFLGVERFSSISALILILQLTSASAILTTDLSNRFFYIGRGLPMYWGVRAFRTLWFGVNTDTMWLNWVVITAFNVVFMPLGLGATAYRVWTNGSWGRRGGVARPINVQMGGVVAVAM